RTAGSTGLGRGKRERREVRAAQLLGAALAFAGWQQPLGISLLLESSEERCSGFGSGRPDIMPAVHGVGGSAGVRPGVPFVGVMAEEVRFSRLSEVRFQGFRGGVCPPRSYRLRRGRLG